MKYRTKNVRKNMIAIRHFNQMNAPEFADKLGIESKRYSELEKGRLMIRKHEAQKVADFHEVTLDELDNSEYHLSIIKR